MTTKHVRSNRRGVALVAVVIVGLSLVLLTLGLIGVVRADIRSLGHSARDAQVRLAAASAVDVILNRLGEQRLDVAAGRPVRLEDRFEIFEIDGGRVAVARLLPIGTDRTNATPEAARLDLNRCDAAALEATGSFDAAQAARIIDARDRRPGGRFVHLSDLLAESPGIDPSSIYGPLEEVSILSRVDGVEDEIGERIRRRLDADVATNRMRPADLLTVHSFEPDLRRDGRPRHLPGDPVDADEIPALAEILARMGASPAEDDARSTADDEDDPEDANAEDGSVAEGVESPDTGIEARLRQAGLRLDLMLSDQTSDGAVDAGVVVDAIGRDPSRWSGGLIDINTASREVLRTLPEIDDVAAGEIVSRRDALADDRRFARTWPFELGILDPIEHASVLDRITTRSFLWRITMAVGTQSIEAEDESLEDPLVWEILVDVGSVPPRLVELRDVTLFEFVARMIDEEGSIDAGPDPTSIGGVEALSAGDGFGIPSGSDPPDDQLSANPPLFSDPPLFPADPLFQDDPLFGDSPLFEVVPRGSSVPRDADGGNPEPADPRSGRWRPATGGR